MPCCGICPAYRIMDNKLVRKMKITVSLDLKVKSANTNKHSCKVKAYSLLSAHTLHTL